MTKPKYNSLISEIISNMEIDNFNQESQPNKDSQNKQSKSDDEANIDDKKESSKKDDSQEMSIDAGLPNLEEFSTKILKVKKKLKLKICQRSQVKDLKQLIISEM